MSASGGWRKSVAGTAAGSELVSIIAQSAGIADGLANNGFGLLTGQDGSYSGFPTQPVLFNGSTWDRPRTPNVFKLVAANAAGDTAVWTPAAGKKFRLMGFLITLANNAAQAAGAALTMQFRDATTPLGIAIAPFVPAAAGAVTGASVWSVPLLGNGILSAAANNVLNFNLAAALTTSFAQIDVWGTEE